MSNNSDSTKGIPEHVCIIMDGNGRWAKKRFMPRTLGHKKGVEITRRSIEYFARSKVKHLTLFAFSSENWNRPAEEVGTLMDLFLRSLQENIHELHDKNIRIRFIGDRSAFSSALQGQIGHSEALTAKNSLMTLNIAANYGGQWDICQSVTQIAIKTNEDQFNNSSVSPDQITANLSLADTPDPDLFIRTGGERRISNFLLWQLAYTELYFTDVLWPDFDEREMQKALDDYQGRQRRWGKTGEQLEGPMPC
ncbi:MAG: undecaprenyl diphosphate synthase [Gammaproteobacteria bacterium]|jgi:undecaprenyl diphosphate synthase